MAEEPGARAGHQKVRRAAMMAAAATIPVGVSVAVPQAPLGAVMTWQEYHSPTLTNGVDYGTNYVKMFGNSMSCTGAEPYKAHIHNTTSGGIRRNRVEGTCGTHPSSIQFAHYNEFFAHWWCGQATGFTRLGECYVIVER